MGQHKIPKTEEKKLYFIFFSKWQKTRNMESGCGATFAKLEDGRIVEYTEMCREERMSGNFINGFVLLGKGDFDHIVETPKYAPETIKARAGRLRNTTSLLKIHSAIPVEKFKIKSPKNIPKKRPYGYN